MEDQIIQICNKLQLILLYLIFICFIYISEIVSKERLTTGNETFSESENFSGNYLSWIFSKKNGDPESIKFFMSKLSDNFSTQDVVIEGFNSSLFSNDWKSSVHLAKKVLNYDKNDFFANLVMFTESFKNENYSQSNKYLTNIKKSEIDENFLQILRAWNVFSIDKSESSLMFLGNYNDCIPIKCLHLGLVHDLLENKDISQKIYLRMLKQNNLTIRLNEIFLSFFIKMDNRKMVDEILKGIHSVNRDFKLDLTEPISKDLYSIESPRDGLAEAYFNISGWFYDKKLYKFSVFFGNLGLNLRNKFPALSSLVAESYKKLQLLEYSLKNLEDIDEDSFYYNTAVISKAGIFDKLGKEDILINLLKESSKEIDSNYLKILLADSLRSKGSYKESIKLYDELISKMDYFKNSDWGIFYSRGIAHERLKKWRMAEKDFLKALELMPNEPYVLNYLGYSWLERNIKLEKALELIIIAAEQKPYDAYIIDSLGWAYFLLGEFSSSIKILEKAVSLSPNDATLNDHLGDAYWKAGRTREAISQWRRVLVFDPNFKKKQNVKEKIKKGI